MPSESPHIAGLRASLAAAVSRQARIRALLELSEALRVGFPPEAQSHAESALELARSLGYEFEIALCRKQLGLCTVADDLRESAYDHLEAAWRVFSHLEEHSHASQTALALGDCLLAQESIDGALRWFVRAADSCRKGADGGGEAAMLRKIGDVQVHNGDREKGLASFHEALRLAEDRNDRTAMGEALAAIAAFHGADGDFDEALEYFHRSRACFAQGLNRPLEVRMLVNIARTHLAKGRLDDALLHAEQARACYTLLDDRSGLAAVLDVIGKVHEGRAEYAQALEHHLQALSVLATIDDEGAEAQALVTIGRLRQQLGDHHEALLTLREALHVAEDRGDRRLQFQIHEMMAASLELLGNFDRALRHHKQFAAIRLEVLDVEKQQAISDMQLRFDLESARREMAQMRLEKEQLQRDGERSAAELSSMTLSLNAHTAFIHDLRLIAEKIEQLCDATTRPLAKGLLRKLKFYRRADNGWQRLFEKLQSRHPGFLDAMSQRCPQLTDLQKRICVMTRLGMNTAEIGDIIAGGPRDGEEQHDRIERARRNVETHRMRIKKRLGLPTGTSLASFLESLCWPGTADPQGHSIRREPFAAPVAAHESIVPADHYAPDQTGPSVDL